MWVSVCDPIDHLIQSNPRRRTRIFLNLGLITCSISAFRWLCNSNLTSSRSNKRTVNQFWRTSLLLLNRGFLTKPLRRLRRPTSLHLRPSNSPTTPSDSNTSTPSENPPPVLRSSASLTSSMRYLNSQFLLCIRDLNWVWACRFCLFVGVFVWLIILVGVWQTRQAYTPEQINEACYVDLNANKEVFNSLRKNPKVYYDGRRFSYKVFCCFFFLFLYCLCLQGGICKCWCSFSFFLFWNLCVFFSPSMIWRTKASFFTWYGNSQRASL